MFLTSVHYLFLSIIFLQDSRPLSINKKVCKTLMKIKKLLARAINHKLTSNKIVRNLRIILYPKSCDATLAIIFDIVEVESVRNGSRD